MIWPEGKAVREMAKYLPEKETPSSEILFYQTEDGRNRIEVRLEDETVWLTQGTMAELFQTTPQNITLHLKNIYQEGELDEAATCKDFLQVQTEGPRQVQRSRRFYNLESIIAVGYRVKSHRGTQFRRWATERLREYLVKGFTMDDEGVRLAILQFISRRSGVVEEVFSRNCEVIKERVARTQLNYFNNLGGKIDENSKS